MMNKYIEEVDVSEIQSGDIILDNRNKEVTLCKKNITKGFMGKCILGDSYMLGLLKVKRVVYEHVKPNRYESRN